MSVSHRYCLYHTDTVCIIQILSVSYRLHEGENSAACLYHTDMQRCDTDTTDTNTDMHSDANTDTNIDIQTCSAVSMFVSVFASECMSVFVSVVSVLRIKSGL